MTPNTPSRLGPAAFARTLAWLRLCAVAGQCVAVLVCAFWMKLAIPLLPLMVGIGTLAVFAVFAAWRLGQPWPVREWETLGYVAVDTLVLGYLLYFTGGATNPFINLLLVPIALSAAALSGIGVLAVALLAGLAYLILLWHYVPLPLPPHQGFALHVIGMGVDFVITALLLGFFIHRLAHALRTEQLQVQRARERALRDAGILAIATQAAGAAHELNTPLGTMCTLLPELRREHAGDATLVADLQLLETQVERCRGILREMVAFGKAQLARTPERMTLERLVHGCRERFQLLRPEAELTIALDADLAGLTLDVPAGLRHALINLLNNAAEASAQRGSHAVALQIRREDAWLAFCVRDHGPGFAAGQSPSLGASGKQTGLGLGLALAEATAERLQGELVTGNHADGAEVCLRLPLAAIEVR
ncbi:ATP-binding protein [Aerosticca soli]|uniref:histidine kinase n=1 Tax=Aerosticca soli TaxID=2010829 RepID=A0A2Z6E6I6_9GAMM|nr:ATP-binding protein [Aerosticca soli]MDI3263293.1 ATP-binding protein [Fulvimonas sp.]BBD80785.1 sensor histidine kinase PrrB [Aerosticca soli]